MKDKRLIVDIGYQKYVLGLGTEPSFVESLLRADPIKEISHGGKASYIEDDTDSIIFFQVVPGSRFVESTPEEHKLIVAAKEEASRYLNEKWAKDAEVRKLQKEIEVLKSLCPAVGQETPDVGS